MIARNHRQLSCLSTVLALAAALSLVAIDAWAATSVLELGLKGDGQANETEPLQKALAAGKLELDFPPGTYLLGTVELPQDAQLQFSPKARIKVDPTKIQELNVEVPHDTMRALLVLKGDRIVIDGLDAEGVLEMAVKDKRGREKLAVNHLVYGENVSDLALRRLRVVLSQKRPKTAPSVIYLQQCRAVVLADSQFENLAHGILASRCQNVSVHGNRAVHCNTLTTFTDSEYLRHYDNWSR